MGKEDEQERTEKAIGSSRSEDSLFFTRPQRKAVALFCGMLTAWMVLASNGVQAAEWAIFKNTIDRQGRTDFIGPQTAQLAWHLQDFDMSSEAVIAADGTIYAGSSNGFFHALTPDGTLKWRYFTNRAVLASPAIDQDGNIYLMSENAVLHALTPNRRVKWRVRFGNYAGPLASPGIGADGTIYVGVHVLYAFNSDGTLKWQRYTGYDITGPPAIGADGTI
ncbi:MAG: PQQ-binding-like beta-propeller repeat protein [Gammaproteobacteria bacterium]|nr:PQQ-binding-like beta-propeller repeat protein [Gammaproteobacteria bacterium]